MIHVPPAEVSRLVLLLFVAAGVVLAITTSGDMASFGRGFAVGAGAALALSRVKRNPEPSDEEAVEGHEGERGAAP
jgi:hypothetical protein